MMNNSLIIGLNLLKYRNNFCSNPSKFFVHNVIAANFCTQKQEKVIDPSKDRRIPIDLDTSIKYMKSDAFKQTYKNYKIWELFRRNFKGQYTPVVPRRSCITEGIINTSNPCPVCRDPYLLLHYKNLDLLKQFICEQTGYVFPNTILCLCFDQYENLCVAVTLAKNHGLIDFEVPLREYDYSFHYKNLPKNYIY